MEAKKRDPTITFRPTLWERALIDERMMLSGLSKRDFIVRSCLYGKIVVTGTQENIRRIIDELQMMESVLWEILTQLRSGEVFITESSFDEIRMEYLALITTVVDIMKGAAYLFHIDNPIEGIDWKQRLEAAPKG